MGGVRGVQQGAARDDLPLAALTGGTSAWPKLQAVTKTRTAQEARTPAQQGPPPAPPRPPQLPVRAPPRRRLPPPSPSSARSTAAGGRWKISPATAGGPCCQPQRQRLHSQGVSERASDHHACPPHGCVRASACGCAGAHSLPGARSLQPGTRRQPHLRLSQLGGCVVGAHEAVPGGGAHRPP